MIQIYKRNSDFYLFSVYWSLYFPSSATTGSLILKTFLPQSGNFTFDFHSDQEISVDKICDDSNSNKDKMAYQVFCNSTHHANRCEFRSLCEGNCNSHNISTPMQSLVQYNIHNVCFESGGLIVLSQH